MARNNLELSAWGDGTMRLSFWDSDEGVDRIWILDADGHAYREYPDGRREGERFQVDLVAELRELVDVWNAPQT